MSAQNPQLVADTLFKPYRDYNWKEGDAEVRWLKKDQARLQSLDELHYRVLEHYNNIHAQAMYDSIAKNFVFKTDEVDSKGNSRTRYSANRRIWKELSQELAAEVMVFKNEAQKEKEKGQGQGVHTHSNFSKPFQKGSSESLYPVPMDLTDFELWLEGDRDDNNNNSNSNSNSKNNDQSKQKTSASSTKPINIDKQDKTNSSRSRMPSSPLSSLEGDLQVSLSLTLSLRFKGLFFYTVGILCHVEWCIRQL